MTFEFIDLAIAAVLGLAFGIMIGVGLMTHE